MEGNNAEIMSQSRHQKLKLLTLSRLSLLTVMKSGYLPALTVLFVLYETWFLDLEHKNPVKLTSESLRPYKDFEVAKVPSTENPGRIRRRHSSQSWREKPNGHTKLAAAFHEARAPIPNTTCTITLHTTCAAARHTTCAAAPHRRIPPPLFISTS